MGEKTYLEFLIGPLEYFSTIKKHEFIYEWIIPLILGIGTYIFYNLVVVTNSIGFIENLLSILIGFSIAALAIITTSSSKNIDKLKKEMLVDDNEKEFLFKPDRQVKETNLYQLLIIQFLFVIGMEILLLVYNLIGQFILPAIYIRLFFTIDVIFISSTTLMTLRAITNLSLVFIRE